MLNTWQIAVLANVASLVVAHDPISRGINKRKFDIPGSDEISFPNTTFLSSSNSCWKSWVSYVEDDVRTLKAWIQEGRSMLALAEKGDFQQTLLPNASCTDSYTKTETLYKTLTPQCDGQPRLLSTGEALMKTASVTSCDVYDRSNPLGSSWKAKDPWDKRFSPFPTCQIRADECDAQWKHFQDAFKNWGLNLVDVSTRGRDLDLHDSKEDPDCTPTGEDPPGYPCVQINEWLDRRQFAAARGYFDGCAQAQAYCLAGSPEYGVGRKCEVRVDRFVLIHFPPEEPKTSRDLCLINSFDLGGSISPSNLDATVTADLKTIVFPAKDLKRVGWDDMPFGTLFGYGTTPTIFPASTMTGTWKFTSPSVYLAYDTINADGDCEHPGRPLTNGILTLHPSELKSIVSTTDRSCTIETEILTTYSSHDLLKDSLDLKTAYGTTSTRCWDEWKQAVKSFDLADLHGPVPSNAYFGALHHNTYNDNRPHTHRCQTTICENLYFPVISLPSAILTSEPAFTSCIPFNHNLNGPANLTYIRGGWDPPIALPPTTVKPIDQHPITANYPVAPATTSAVPRLLASNFEAVATKTPSLAENLQPAASHDNLPYLHGPIATVLPTMGEQPIIYPTAALTIGGHIINVSALSNTNAVVFGSETLRVGGPAIVAAGSTISLASNGYLNIDNINIPLKLQPTPTPAAIFRVNGQAVTGTYVESNKGKSGFLVIGSTTLQPGGPAVAYSSRTLSLNSEGVLFDGLDPVTTISKTTIMPLEPVPKKKSGSTRCFGQIPSFSSLIALTLGACLQFAVF